MQEYLITLEAARVNAGLTQAEAAIKIGVHPQTLAKWEKDSSRIPYTKVCKIEATYHVPKGLIFFGKSFEFTRKLLKNQ
jgi:transcriptional regulator, xre family